MLTSRLRSFARLSGVLLILALPACSKSSGTSSTADHQDSNAPGASLQVSHIELGRSVDADKRVTDATKEFTPKETVYASVVTNGAASDAEVKARWTYQDGQVVEETTQHISPTGPAATEFHVSKPDGWPAGKYKVEIYVNQQLAGAEEFEVKSS